MHLGEGAAETVAVKVNLHGATASGEVHESMKDRIRVGFEFPVLVYVRVVFGVVSMLWYLLATPLHYLMRASR